MRVFKVEKSNLVSFIEENFKIDNTEKILEDWIENTPSALFENEEVFIIGRQVTTNLNKAIDLLGIDKNGNIVIVELKRGKTPRETVAQILEYVSFVEDLTYKQLEEIASKYIGDEGINLTESHNEFFKLPDDFAVAFNKAQRLIIVGQEISKETEQTSVFLNKKGLELYCIAFKYFKSDKGERIITSDFVVKKDKSDEVKTESKPKINKSKFLDNVDDYIREFFKKLLNLASENKMPIHWGGTGFSLNVDLSGNHVNILYGYSKLASGGHSIYTAAMEIRRKVNNAEEVIDQYFEKLRETNLFEPASNEIKWIITNSINDKQVKVMFDAILFVKEKIEINGLID
ncbi:endonuclease NucS domain-containing protein [Actinomycetota bacterium]